MKSKLTSRKFWVTVAAMLASIGSTIGGAYTDNETIMTVGIICTVASTCIYTIAESLIDVMAIPDTYDETEDTNESEG